jgi:hypothetical protein
MKNVFPKAICCLCALMVVGFIWSCAPAPPSPNSNLGSNNNSAAPSGAVVPEPFPNPGIAGFNFPEQASVLDGWIKDAKNEDIYKHGWGIWAGLTTVTKQVPAGGTEPLLVFETWQTPAEIIAAISNDQKNALSARSNRSDLSKPHQFVHAAEKGDTKFAAKATTEVKTGNSTPGNTNAANANSAKPNASATPDTNIAVSVSYSPAAAKYATDNKIFLYDTLKGYGDAGRTEIPAFPSDAITLKPTFKVIQK